jgi:CRISPR/Cas system type I-B associated protein Csh2 (Cas7 group RAMP superfamily)
MQVYFKSHSSDLEGYSSLKTNKTKKSVVVTKEREKNSKGKSVKAKEEVCGSNLYVQMIV